MTQPSYNVKAKCPNCGQEEDLMILDSCGECARCDSLRGDF